MVEALFNSKVDVSWTPLPPFPKGPSLDLIHNLHLSDLFWVVLNFAGCTFPGWIIPNKKKFIHIMGYKAIMGSMDFAMSNLAQK
jgi:hypothetical protein